MSKDHVLKDLEDFEEDIEEATKKKLPSWFWKVVAIFVIGIFVVYLLPGDVVSVLAGRLESSSVGEDFTVEYDSGLVVFKQGIYEKLVQLYLDNTIQEIKVCLEGSKEGTDYYIDKIHIPTIFSQSVIHVSSEGCSKDTLISMHTHPYRHCLFSEQDVKSHERIKKINPEALTGLMCEVNRFSFLE